MPSAWRGRSSRRRRVTGETLGDLIATLGSIDDDAIDWQNVQQTTVLIQQTFSYEYPGPIAALRHRLIVVPPDYHDNQRLLTRESIRVWLRCRYRALVRHVRQRCPRPQRRARRAHGRVQHLGVVEREAAVDGTDTPDAIGFDQRFAEPSRLTHTDDALRAVADAAPRHGLQSVELADQIGHRVRALRVPLRCHRCHDARCGCVGGRYRSLPGLRALHAGSLPAVRVARPLRVRSRARRGGRARAWRSPSSGIRRTRTRCAPFPSIPPTTAARACVTSRSRWAATTTTCRRPRAPSTRPTAGN